MNLSICLSGEPYDDDWKDRVRTRIKRSDGVLVLVSKSSLNSSGQKWEMACAKEEKKRIPGIGLIRMIELILMV